MKRKMMLTILAPVLLLLLCACKKEEVPMIPYNQGNNVDGFPYIMENENSYYYNPLYYNSSGALNLHCLDKKTGNDIFLCCRPECAHDGNSLCTATNENYYVFRSVLYGNNIYSTAVVRENSNIRMCLIKNSIDGTKLTEVGTFTKKVTDSNSYSIQKLILHNGKAFFAYHFLGSGDNEDGEAGCCVMDLETGKSEHLYEGSYENRPYDLNACGDFLFFLRDTEKRKGQLTRYQLSTKEMKETEIYIKGHFSVLDENRIIYLTKLDGAVICDVSTGEKTVTPISTEIKKLKSKENDLLVSVENASLSKLYVYQDYVIIMDSYIRSSEDQTPCVLCYVFKIDEWKLLSLSYLPIQSCDKKNISKDQLENTFYSHQEVLLFHNDTVYLPDFYSQVVSGSPFSDFVNGKVNMQEKFVFRNNNQVFEEETNQVPEY